MYIVKYIDASYFFTKIVANHPPSFNSSGTSKLTEHHPTPLWLFTHLLKGVSCRCIVENILSYYIWTLSPNAWKPGSMRDCWKLRQFASDECYWEQSNECYWQCCALLSIWLWIILYLQCYDCNCLSIMLRLDRLSTTAATLSKTNANSCHWIMTVLPVEAE